MIKGLSTICRLAVFVLSLAIFPSLSSAEEVTKITSGDGELIVKSPGFACP